MSLNFSRVFPPSGAASSHMLARSDGDDSAATIMELYVEGNKGLYLGPLMMGFLIDAILLGVILISYGTWHGNSMKEDKWPIKLLVWYLIGLSLGITIFLLRRILDIFVYDFGAYSKYVDPKWTSWWFLLDMLSRVPVSAFFAYRAWEMSKRSKVFATIVGLLLASVVVVVLALKATYSQMKPFNEVLILLHVGLEMLADIIVTATITFFFIRSRTGWEGTDRLISKLLRLVAETQLPPTLMALAFLITYLAVDNNPVGLVFVCMPKIYVICLLVVLNSRLSLRRDMSVFQRYRLGTFEMKPAEPTSDTRQAVAGIRVVREVVTETLKVDSLPNLKPKSSIPSYVPADTRVKTDSEW